MNELEDCPKCLGTGENLFKGRFNTSCNMCDGGGEINSEIAMSHINQGNV